MSDTIERWELHVCNVTDPANNIYCRHTGSCGMWEIKARFSDLPTYRKYFTLREEPGFALVEMKKHPDYGKPPWELVDMHIPDTVQAAWHYPTNAGGTGRFAVWHYDSNIIRYYSAEGRELDHLVQDYFDLSSARDAVLKWGLPTDEQHSTRLYT